MAAEIAVEPAWPGWVVRGTTFDNAMMFRNGGLAEAAARRLATKMSESGMPVELHLRTMDGGRGATVRYAANRAGVLHWW